MAKAKNKIVEGLEDAAEYARVRAAVRDWLEFEYLVMIPDDKINKLVDRICGSRTHSR